MQDAWYFASRWPIKNLNNPNKSSTNVLESAREKWKFNNCTLLCVNCEGLLAIVLKTWYLWHSTPVSNRVKSSQICRTTGTIHSSEKCHLATHTFTSHHMTPRPTSAPFGFSSFVSCLAGRQLAGKRHTDRPATQVRQCLPSVHVVTHLPYFNGEWIITGKQWEHNSATKRMPDPGDWLQNSTARYSSLFRPESPDQ